MSESARLEWFPFHDHLRSQLREWAPEVWERLAEEVASPASNETAQQIADWTVTRDQEPGLYELLDRASDKLPVSVDVQLGLDPKSKRFDASIRQDNQTAWLILHGKGMSQLEPHEMLAVMGHELGHLNLSLAKDGSWLVMDRWLQTAAASQSLAWNQTLRLHRLYSECYCDRAALLASQNLLACVSALTKVGQQKHDLQPAAELKAAQERLRERDSHPANGKDESFANAIDLRVQALWLADNRWDMPLAEIQQQLQPRTSDWNISVFEQSDWVAWTLSAIEHWIDQEATDSKQTTQLLDRFREDLPQPPSSRWSLAEVDKWIKAGDAPHHDFACFLLLDLVTCHQEARDSLLVSALAWADRWKVTSRFDEVARRELRLGKRQLQQIKTEALRGVRKEGTS